MKATLIYTALGHKLRFPPSKKAQFVTECGIKYTAACQHGGGMLSEAAGLTPFTSKGRAGVDVSTIH